MCDIYICITFFLYQVIEVFGVLHFSFDNNNDTLAIGSNRIVAIALYFVIGSFMSSLETFN